jgi:hypothetical protein
LHTSCAASRCYATPRISSNDGKGRRYVTMIIDLTETIFVSGADLEFQHGVYPRTLNKFNMSKKPILKDAGVLVLWFKEKPEAYPTLGQVNLNPDGGTPQGGVRIDVDYPEVATFGVYSKVDAGSYALQAWFDFDHWPGEFADGVYRLTAGLNDSHYHTAANQQEKKPCDGSHRQLWMQVIAGVRSRGGVSINLDIKSSRF